MLWLDGKEKDLLYPRRNLPPSTRALGLHGRNLAKNGFISRADTGSVIATVRIESPIIISAFFLSFTTRSMIAAKPGMIQNLASVIVEKKRSKKLFVKAVFKKRKRLLSIDKI